MKSNFKVGQTVYCVLFGEGVVTKINPILPYPVDVKFVDNSLRGYTLDGKYLDDSNRTLFFTKPEVKGATEPVFEPQLKEGDKVVAVWGNDYSTVFTVHKEIEDKIYVIDSAEDNKTFYPKSNVKFFKLGYEIKF